MKKQKICNLDERQLQQYAAVNSVAVWTAYGMLCASILVQTAFGGGRFDTIGETVTLLVVCLVMAGGYLKYGIWDNTQRFSMKKNILLSSVAGVLLGVAQGISSYRRYGHPMGAVAAGVVIAVSTTILCIVVLQLCWGIYRRRQKKLEVGDDTPEKED